MIEGGHSWNLSHRVEWVLPQSQVGAGGGWVQIEREKCPIAWWGWAAHCNSPNTEGVEGNQRVNFT